MHVQKVNFIYVRILFLLDNYKAETIIISNYKLIYVLASVGEVTL